MLETKYYPDPVPLVLEREPGTFTTPGVCSTTKLHTWALELACSQCPLYGESEHSGLPHLPLLSCSEPEGHLYALAPVQGPPENRSNQESVSFRPEGQAGQWLMCPDLLITGV